MNRRNLVIGSLVAGLLTLPLLAAAQGSSTPSSGSEAAKAAPSAMQAQSAMPAQHTTTQPAATKSTTSSGKSSAHSAPKLDLNAATREELIKLPGVGEATADKIIAARPFKSKNELVSRKLVSQSEYNKISAHVIAKQPAVASK